MKRSVYEAIKTGLQNGVYKGVRLIRWHEGGDRDVLIPFSKIGSTEQAISRLEHIKLQLDRKLEPGTYLVECRSGNTQSSLIDTFEVIIKAPVMVPMKTTEPKTDQEQDEIIDKTEDQESMPQIEYEDWLQLVRDNEKLKAENSLLLTQLSMYEKGQMGNAPLNDPAPKTTTEKILSGLNDNLPTIIGVFNEFMDQRKKGLELKERELDLKEGKKRIMPSKKQVQKINPDDVVRDLQNLRMTDPDSFEDALDALEEKNPALFEYCCNALGIELYDDEDLQEEEGEEEQE